MQRLAALAGAHGFAARSCRRWRSMSGSLLAQRLDPAGEAGLEQLRVERVDHVVERVVGRNAALVGQETPQEVEPLFAPQPDLDEILHARQRGAEHQQQYLRQRIQDPPALAGVRQSRKMVEQREGGRACATSKAPNQRSPHESHSFVNPVTAVNLKRSPCGPPAPPLSAPAAPSKLAAAPNRPRDDESPDEFFQHDRLRARRRRERAVALDGRTQVRQRQGARPAPAPGRRLRSHRRRGARPSGPGAGARDVLRDDHRAARGRDGRRRASTARAGGDRRRRSSRRAQDFGLAPPTLDGVLAVRGVVEIVEAATTSATLAAACADALASLDEAIDGARSRRGAPKARRCRDPRRAARRHRRADAGRRRQSGAQARGDAGAARPVDRRADGRLARLRREPPAPGGDPDRRQGRHPRGARSAEDACRGGARADPGGGPVGRRLDFLAQELGARGQHAVRQGERRLAHRAGA